MGAKKSREEISVKNVYMVNLILDMGEGRGKGKKCYLQSHPGQLICGFPF